MGETFRLGLMASAYGLIGVFAVLILFYLMTRGLMKFFSK